MASGLRPFVISCTAHLEASSSQRIDLLPLRSRCVVLWLVEEFLDSTGT